MSTPNFLNQNCKYTHVLWAEDEWDYEDHFHNVSASLKKAGYHCHKSPQKAPWVKRYAGGRVIGDKAVYKFYGEAEVGVYVRAIIRNGYFQHMNLDYDYILSIGDIELDESLRYDSYSIADILRLDFDMNSGLAKIQAGYVENWLDDTLCDMTDQLEKIYLQHATQYVRTCVASNGEAFYEKAEVDQ